MADRRRGGGADRRGRGGGKPGTRPNTRGSRRAGSGKGNRAAEAPAAPAARVAASPGTVHVNGYSTRWVGQGFPWVYPAELTSDLPAPGTVVAVVGADSRVLGVGVVDAGWIAVRIYRHGPVVKGGTQAEAALNDAWLDSVLTRAWALRQAVVPEGTSAFRLLHGENDGLPGLRVDHWAGHIVCQCDTPATAALAQRVVDRLLAGVLTGLTVHTAWRCYRPDPRDPRDKKDFRPAAGQIAGPSDLMNGPDVIAVEAGVKVGVRPWDGPDVGCYADMREVRRWLSTRVAGKSVLNTFSYTGLFSAHAAVHGATRVVSVDLGSPVLERAKDNFRLNGLAVDDGDFMASDTFRALDVLRRKGDRFDVVILDPPSFSHGPDGTWSITQHMTRLVAAAARVVAPGGWLVVASNHGQTAPKVFRGHVADGLRKAGLSGLELAFFGSAPDYPAATTFPEAHYLKVGVWATVER